MHNYEGYCKFKTNQKELDCFITTCLTACVAWLNPLLANPVSAIILLSIKLQKIKQKLFARQQIYMSRLPFSRPRWNFQVLVGIPSCIGHSISNTTQCWILQCLLSIKNSSTGDSSWNVLDNRNCSSWALWSVRQGEARHRRQKLGFSCPWQILRDQR